MHAETALLTCPYCWQEIEVVVDPSVARQTYVEDCSVCCRPIVVTVTAEEGTVVSVEAAGEDD